jgi:sulfur carrier protein ThiS
VPAPPVEAPGSTVRDVLEAVFEGNGPLRPYVLDDQGALRHHVVVFVDGRAVTDRVGLTDPVGEDGRLHVMQALSGG